MAGYRISNTSGIALSTDNEGISIPTTANVAGLRTAGVPTGSLVYATADSQLYAFNGTSWVKADTSGTSGTSGSSGTAGTSGTSGSSGTSGATGTSGTSGIDGPQGPQGPIGPQGVQGPQGIQGPIGPQGAQGPNGTSGTTGTSGSSGTAGTSGSSGTSGTSGTSGSSGTSGTSGSSGTAGTSGGIGPQGPTGPQGNQGPIGTGGSSGTSGGIGPQGPQGPLGPQGATGPQGAQGPQGLQGPQGVQGPSGTSGTSGSSGTRGTSGSSGTSGTSGSSGTAGTSGGQGPGGSSGTSGNSGSSGTSGTSGGSGTSGSSGTSAASAITNNTNNYVVTATGDSGTPFNGEANLRFDGTNLGIGGAGSYPLDVNQTGGGSGTASAMLVRAGNNATYFGNNQILLGYSGGAQYMHAIKSRHQSNNTSGNALDFYMWQNGQAIGDVGDFHVVTMENNTKSARVGIGTTTPDYTLEVVTSRTLGYRLQTSNSTVGNPQIDLYDSGRVQETVISSTDGTTTGTYIASYSNHPLLFGTNAGTSSTAKMTLSTGGNLTVTGTIGASNFSGSSSGTNTGDQTNISGNAATVGNLTPIQFFNNMGNVHGTWTDFNTIDNFGFRYVQGSTNGPGTGSQQFYGVSLGLGNEYSYALYALQLAIPRYNYDTGGGGPDRYLSIRSKENGSWNSWQKISAGYADTAGALTTPPTLAIVTANGSSTSTSVTFSGNVTNTGIFYMKDAGPSINENRINAGWNSTGDAIDLWINYEGYLNSNSYFRDFRVGNGKRGSSIIFVDGSANNVGITTDSPLAKLSIGTGSLADSNLPIQQSTGAGGTGTYHGFNKNGSYGLLVGMSNGLDGWTAGVMRMVTSDPIYFITSNTSIAATINASGNFGMGGNTTPQYKLDVYQASGIAASFGGTFSPGVFGGIHFGYLETGNTAYRKSALVFERTDNHNQGGNASGKIHFLLNNVASQSATSLSSAVVTIDSDANGTNGSVRMGVGTTSPSYVLHVNGTGYFSSTLTMGAAINLGSNRIYTSGYNTPNVIVLNDDSNWTFGGFSDSSTLYWMQVKYYGTGDDNRGFRLFNTNGNTVTWRVNGAGSMFTTGDVTAYSSDRRLKDNITNIPNSLAKVLSLNGVTFDWNDTAINAGFIPKIRYGDSGVIAQEVQEVLPQAVDNAPFDWEDGKSRSGENYLTVKYEKIVPLLIEAIKEQQATIASLEARINSLESR